MYICSLYNANPDSRYTAVVTTAFHVMDNEQLITTVFDN